MTARPTAAPAHWPYAHPTMEEVRRIESVPVISPVHARLIREAREAAEATLRPVRTAE